VLGKVRDWLAIGLGVLMLQAFCIPASQAAEVNDPCPKKTRCVLVEEPYLEIHTGPGVGYPVFHVVSRGEQLQVLRRRTDWFYVRTNRDIEGWVGRTQMLSTLELTGEPVDLAEPSRSDFTTRHWEAGAFIGRFEGVSLLGIFAGYGFSDHLTAELTLSDAISNVAESRMATIGLNHTFAPEWLISPYAGVGTGIITILPRATLVQPEDQTDQIGYVAAGVRGYVARRFLLRAEYRGNVIFTSRNENEEIHEWKLGFAFFF
jgi:hypothetical protein